MILSSHEFPPQSPWLCLVPEPPQLSEGSLCAFCLPKRSGYCPKPSNQKQLRGGKGLFSLQFQDAAHPSSWDVKAGTRWSHDTQSQEQEETSSSCLLFAALLMLGKFLYPYCPGPPVQGMAPPAEGLPKPVNSQDNSSQTDIHTDLI